MEEVQFGMFLVDGKNKHELLTLQFVFKTKYTNYCTHDKR
jgi:hypothetical protein